ncbi:MAG TPA: alpha/beta fold hydrolase [Terriglobales bacterium]|nr:alpha/beta fold hydrolase [Terriglobales bacterium]
MRRTHVEPRDCGSTIRTQEYREANVPILGEVLFAAELVLLHAAPLYYGLGIPHGDGSAVILIPAFLCPNVYLTPLHQWLARIGYKPFFSGIGFNTECPNLLIKRQLNVAIEKALATSGRKVHLIGHSLGGIIARAIAAQRPADVASVITLGAPFRGTVAHPSILHAARMVRRRILAKHGTEVLPDCYTGHCTCDFLGSLRHAMPASVAETAVYSEGDGVVDWRYCKTDRPESDFSVSGTHVGLVFNPSVYTIVAERLAKAGCEEVERRARGKRS